LIVEVPKELPLKGNWLYVVAENWIEDQVLYLPDAKYSIKYKLTMLKCGVPPDVENWDRHDVFKIVGTFGIYFSFILRDYFHLICIVLTNVVDFINRDI
jgi:hypothetical protein